MTFIPDVEAQVIVVLPDVRSHVEDAVDGQKEKQLAQVLRVVPSGQPPSRHDRVAGAIGQCLHFPADRAEQAHAAPPFGDARRGPSSRGNSPNNNAVAAIAKPAPVRNAAGGDTRVQISPNSRLAPSAPAPSSAL